MPTNDAKSTVWSQEMLELYFLNQAAAGIGDAGGLQPSATAGNIYISWHSADPGEGGTQETNELSYAGYSRIAVARSGVQWTVTDGDGGGKLARNNLNLLMSSKKTDSGSVTATWWGIGDDASGAGKLRYRVQIEDPSGGLTIAQGNIPRIPAQGLTIEED